MTVDGSLVAGSEHTDAVTLGVQALGWLRLGLGVVALVAPSLPARPWVGDEATKSSTRTLARALGARDIALGLGTIVARRGRPVRQWLIGSSLADAGDVAATLIGWRDRPRVGRVAVLAAATAGAVTCGVLAARTSP